MKPIFSRGPALKLRLFLAIIMAISIIIVDSCLETFVKIRTYMDTAISPFYFLANGPCQMLDNVSQTLAARDKLVMENRVLRKELLLKNSEQLLLGQYKQENIRLRKLLGSPLRQNEQKMVTQVISISNDPYSNQVVIDKGIDDGVYIGQPVINNTGVVGQVIATNKLTSRVLLICDVAHALPVQVLRNDIRMIVAGNGCTEYLQLKHLPRNADICVGDVLVTSGLGGHFPEGYPVAVVSSVKVDNQRGYTIIQARLTAGLQSLRYLLLLGGADSCGKVSRTPDEVHRVANERLMQMIPQELPHSDTIVLLTPAGVAGITDAYSVNPGVLINKSGDKTQSCRAIPLQHMVNIRPGTYTNSHLGENLLQRRRTAVNLTNRFSNKTGGSHGRIQETVSGDSVSNAIRPRQPLFGCMGEQ
ncbi:rod shape-determining protein MreC [Sodalis endosymbiont of Henestaris halophilus]|nr:Cell shape-determining protein MreC [Sodalis endosymbiont of Henestaris halophilus]